MAFGDFLRNIFAPVIDIFNGGGMGNSGSQNLNQMTDIYEGMQGDYNRYRFALENPQGLLANPPQINLDPYIGRMDMFTKMLMSDVGRYQDLFGGYRDLANQYSGSMLDEYLRSAGQIEDISQTSLEEALGSYQSYLQGYKNLARSDIPGMDILRGGIGAQTAQNIGRLKDIGGMSAGSFTNLLTNQNDQMRQLAVQSGMYRAQRQQDLANAYGQYGNMTQGAYGNRLNALASAAGLRGAGYTGAANIQQGLGLGSTIAEAGVTQNAINSAANIQGMGAGLTGQQFQYNQFLPWQTAVNYYSGAAQQTLPYEAGLNLYGNLFGLELAQRQQMMNLPSQIMGYVQGQGSQLLNLFALGGMGSGGSVPTGGTTYNPYQPYIPQNYYQPNGIISGQGY
jgi:hypothetical protein